VTDSSTRDRPLSVIVLAYDGLESALRLVSSLGDDLGIIIVHNPGPATPDAADVNLCPVISLPENVGYAAAMNIGLAAVAENRSTYVLLLTHDVSIGRDAVEALVSTAVEEPSFGILGPVMHDAATGVIFSTGGLVDLDTGIGHRTSIESGRVAPCDWIDGAVMLLSTRMIEEVGPIDERFFLYYEESDFAFRALAAGWGVGVVMAANAVQRVGAPRRPGAYTYLMTRNELEFRRRALGSRAVVRMLGQVAWQCIREAVVLVLRRSNESRRAEIRIVLPAKVVGIAHFVVRRFGPPPRWLPGLGDVRI